MEKTTAREKKGSGKTKATKVKKEKSVAAQTKSKRNVQKEKPKHENVVRYSDAELAGFKELITGKLSAARTQLKYLQNQLKGSDIGDSDKSKDMSDGTLGSEREYLSQMAAREIQLIGHLEKALIRIENKTYGICRETGKLITKDRLRAVPHATLSIEAKQGQQN